MRFLAAFAIAALLAGCMTTEHARAPRYGVRAAQAPPPVQTQAAARPLVLGLAY